MQGFRPHMQDDFSCIPTAELQQQQQQQSLGFFAVFDGHGHHGEMVSQYCSDNFLTCLLARKSLRKARSLTPDVLESALKKTFVKFDSQLREAAQNYKSVMPDGRKITFMFSGTTATVALVLKDTLVIANTGDSRTLLSRSGGLHFSTVDHSPENEGEQERILAAGGKIHTTPSKHKVIMDTQAYTNLAVSRTLGDFGFKRAPKISVENQVQGMVDL